MRAVIPSTYDADIERAAALFLPQWDWRWLKAQLYAESELKPDAVSAAGAKGIAQIMPGTWEDAAAALHFPATATPFEARYAIRAAAWYMSVLRSKWKSLPRSEDDRRRLAQASYNAGLGNLIKAQKRAQGALDYPRIIARLSEVTGHANAHETTTYVERIARVYTELAHAGA